MTRRALIMAGGTGGHVFPALAVAQQLRAQGWQLAWLGTARGIEARLVPQADIELHTIAVQGLRGKGLLSLLTAPVNLLRALWQARTVLSGVKPDLVLGFGGFASGPGGLVAALRGVPLLIHEQNARAGTTNRLLARLARRVLEAFRSGLPRAEQVGNPVRADICALPAPAERFAGRTGALRILVLGGSQGARAINGLIPALCRRLGDTIEVRHQTGEKLYEETLALYVQAGLPVAGVSAFIGDMAEAYGWADLVICRAGALTVSEISVAGLAAIFVPFPQTIDDHQTANAQWLADQGAALVRQQRDLTEDWLVGEITKLNGDRAALYAIAGKARAQALPDAACQVAAICQEIVNG